MDILILPWHSLHTAVEDSPRTETMPGKGSGVEQPEQVGMKLLRQTTLVTSKRKGSGERSCIYLGSMSVIVHPSRSKYPARTELACISSLR